MSAPNDAPSADRTSGDHAALRLMLSYVESECLRIGATDAARHAALAAALMPGAGAAQSARRSGRPRRGRRLH